MPMIDAAIHDAVMALPPDERRDRAKAYGLTGPPTYSACSHLPTIPPMTSSTMGATQNSHSDCKAVAPPNTAVAVDRAGLREALDTGIATK